VERGTLRAFHALPGLPRIQFCDLAAWYEDEAVRILNRHRTNPTLSGYRTHPLLNAWRAFAHQCVGYALKIGLLERRGCIYCGAQAEAHHRDYRKPLWVVWLCVPHHRAHHGRIRTACRLLEQTGSPAQIELYPACEVHRLIEEARAK
jgi:hypothetical protein